MSKIMGCLRKAGCKRKCTEGFLSQGTKQTICNNEVSELAGIRKAGFDCTTVYPGGVVLQ